MVIVCNNLFLDQQKSNIYIIGKILSTHFLIDDCNSDSDYE